MCCCSWLVMAVRAEMVPECRTKQEGGRVQGVVRACIGHHVQLQRVATPSSEPPTHLSSTECKS